jgi:hypothetical protein
MMWLWFAGSDIDEVMIKTDCNEEESGLAGRKQYEYRFSVLYISAFYCLCSQIQLSCSDEARRFRVRYARQVLRWTKSTGQFIDPTFLSWNLLCGLWHTRIGWGIAAYWVVTVEYLSIIGDSLFISQPPIWMTPTLEVYTIEARCVSSASLM